MSLSSCRERRKTYTDRIPAVRIPYTYPRSQNVSQSSPTVSRAEAETVFAATSRSAAKGWLPAGAGYGFGVVGYGV